MRRDISKLEAIEEIFIPVRTEQPQSSRRNESHRAAEETRFAEETTFRAREQAAREQVAEQDRLAEDEALARRLHVALNGEVMGESYSDLRPVAAIPFVSVPISPLVYETSDLVDPAT